MLDVCRDGTRLEVRGTLDAEGGRTLLRSVVDCAGDVHVDGRTFEVITMPPAALRELRARRDILRLLQLHRHRSDGM
jgi:hypothetical protein